MSEDRKCPFCRNTVQVVSSPWSSDGRQVLGNDGYFCIVCEKFTRDISKEMMSKGLLPSEN